MKESEIIRAAQIAQTNFIDEFEKKLADAIKSEDWVRAAELDSCIRGMKQILILFEQAMTR